MNGLEVATQNDLDTFGRTLHGALTRAGVAISPVLTARVADRIPRFFDCSGPSEPLLRTGESLRTALGTQGVQISDRHCNEVAGAILPYISVLDSNLE